MNSLMKLIILANLIVWATTAQMSFAGLMCATRYENNTVQNLGCELGSTSNDFLSDPFQVNIDEMFGYTDWEYAWKDETGDPLADGLVSFDLSTSLLSGSFSIDWADPAQGDVMFVLKDGQDDPDTYVGWLLDPANFGLQEYAFNTPFLNTSSNTLKEISHATFYYRNGGPTRTCIDCDPVSVPEPAPLALMGLGLLALGMQARKRK